jgi:hypothetical protein
MKSFSAAHPSLARGISRAAISDPGFSPARAGRSERVEGSRLAHRCRYKSLLATPEYFLGRLKLDRQVFSDGRVGFIAAELSDNLSLHLDGLCHLPLRRNWPLWPMPGIFTIALGIASHPGLKRIDDSARTRRPAHICSWTALSNSDRRRADFSASSAPEPSAASPPAKLPPAAQLFGQQDDMTMLTLARTPGPVQAYSRRRKPCFLEVSVQQM